MKSPWKHTTALVSSGLKRWWFLLPAIKILIISSVFLNRKKPLLTSMSITLKNEAGVEVHIIRTGACIQRLIVPDRSGHAADIVLGFDQEQPYKDGTSPYFGAVVGRVANRIANATFDLDGKRYELAANNGPNCLHGGVVGFSRREWAVAEQGKTADGSEFVKLTYTSPDGEEGFPGEVSASVTYSLSSDAATLRVDMSATTTAATPLNLAQHSYFNLGGHDSGDILGHELTLLGDHYTPVNDVQIPTGDIVPVAATPMDFTTPHLVGARIEEVPGPGPGGYDHNYVLFGLGPDAKDKVKHGMAHNE